MSYIFVITVKNFKKRFILPSSLVRLKLIGVILYFIIKQMSARKSTSSKASVTANGNEDISEPKPIRGPRTKAVSHSKLAGLQFPVGRIHRLLRKGNTNRIGRGSAVYMAAVLEYLTAEILELAGNAARDNKKQRITPRHLQLAIRNDEELAKMLSKVTLPQSGVLPHIHPLLLKMKTQDTFRSDDGDADDSSRKSKSSSEKQQSKSKISSKKQQSKANISSKKQSKSKTSSKKQQSKSESAQKATTPRRTSKRASTDLKMNGDADDETQIEKEESIADVSTTKSQSQSQRA
ncbi:unnamed protein product [Didymodactylos carnosus]|uniref:Histone H2A n=1 Tax=Didymodactylos carnosus TaxID=1234261 RepID=A0A813PIM9_9BILA|nr:unnamed protein product [Didymodactylos carnosus]CAF0910396.1 unnamed protein product [Didymodactylos carnosus]CAF3533419.1 unnamed protein product [Didymodactylos carnosus]CAF3689508.1 unnamed protein product [Didymodactylos carnosus]